MRVIWEIENVNSERKSLFNAPYSDVMISELKRIGFKSVVKDEEFYVVDLMISECGRFTACPASDFSSDIRELKEMKLWPKEVMEQK